MAYTLIDIASKVGQRIRDSGYSTSEITDYLNDTINDVYNEYRLPFMQTTQNYTVTIGVSDITNSAALPTNFVQAIDLIYTTAGAEQVIEYRDYTTLDTEYPDEDDTTAHPTADVPQYWYFYANTIKVYPAPKKAYTLTLRYYKKPTALSAPTSVPEIPSQFEELLVMGASYRIMQVKDNYDQAAILQNKYDEILDKLVLKYSQPQLGKPLIINSRNRRRVGKMSF